MCERVALLGFQMTSPDLERLSEQACDALNEGDYPRALALTDQLVQACPTNGEFRCWRAWALLRTGSVAEALQDAQGSVEHAPGWYEAHYVLAVTAAHVEKNQLAQSSFEKAVELSGRRPEILEEFAVWMSLVRSPRVAEEVVMEAIKVGSESPRCWAALGQVRLCEHRHAEAESSLKRALELDPNCTMAQVAMTELLMATGQEPRAAALAAVMSDSPEAESFAKQVQEAARERESRKKLFEREEVVNEVFGRDRWKARLALLPPVVMICAIILLLVSGLYLMAAGLAVALALWWWADR